MDRRKFIAIRTSHNEASKTVMWEGAATYEESDREWARNYTFARCRRLNNWIGHDDFFFASGKPKMVKQYLMHWRKLVMRNLYVLQFIKFTCIWTLII